MKPFDYESVLVFVNLVGADQVHRSGAVAHGERHVQGPYRGAAGPCKIFFGSTIIQIYDSKSPVNESIIVAEIKLIKNRLLIQASFAEVLLFELVNFHPYSFPEFNFFF